MDTTVQVQIFVPDFDEYIECVECQYQERRPTADELTQIQATTHDDGVGMVKFISKWHFGIFFATIGYICR